MPDIFYPSKNDNNKIYIAVLAKGRDIEAKDVTVEYRRKKEDEFFKYINLDINKSIFMHQVHQVNIEKIDENNINKFGGREKLAGGIPKSVSAGGNDFRRIAERAAESGGVFHFRCFAEKRSGFSEKAV